MLFWFIFVVANGLWPTEKHFTTAKSILVEGDKKSDLLLEKNTANTYIKIRYPRSLQSLSEECCQDSHCSYEERSEHASTTDWDSVISTLCDLTENQNKPCKCSNGFFGGYYSCTRYYSQECRRYSCTCNKELQIGHWDIMSNTVKYNFNQASISLNHVTINKIINDNLSGTVSKSTSFTTKKEVTETQTFKQNQGSHFQEGFYFTSGVPKFSDGKIIPTVVSSSKHWHFDVTQTDTFTRESKFDCPAGPGKYVECRALLTIATVTVPYTLKAKNNKYNCMCASSGVYIKVTSTELRHSTKTFDYDPLASKTHPPKKPATTPTQTTPTTKREKKSPTTTTTINPNSPNSHLDNKENHDNLLRPTVENNRSIVIGLLMIFIFIVVPLLACFVVRHKERVKSLLCFPLSYKRFDSRGPRQHSEIESISSQLNFEYPHHKTMDIELNKFSRKNLQSSSTSTKVKKTKPRKSKSLKCKSKLIKKSPCNGKSSYSASLC